MFYSNIIFTKKGPLGLIWLAAHLSNKISKKQIVQVNIEESVQSVSSPPMPLALRLSGHLLLGIVKIYQRKVRYLLNDCNESLAKIKMAFRPGMVDMPADQNVAAYHSITLPDHFDNIDLNLADFVIQGASAVDYNIIPTSTNVVARLQDITLKDTININDLRRPIEEDTFGAADEHWFEERPMNEGQGGKASRVSLAVTDGGDDGGADDDMGPAFMDIDNGPAPADPADRPASPVLRGESPIHDTFLNRSDDAEVVEPPTKKRKVRFLLSDASTELSGDDIKKSLEDTSRIVRESKYSPPTKRQNTRKIEDLFTSPFCTGFASELTDLFDKNMFAPAPATPKTPLATPAPPGTPGGPGGDEDCNDGFDEQPALEFEPPMPPHEEPVFTPTPARDMFGFVGEDSEEKTPSQHSGSQTEQVRTAKMIELLQNAFQPDQDLTLGCLVQSQPKKNAANAFYQLLVLKTRDYIGLVQSEPYGAIHISPTATFPADTVAAAS
eukprot:gnl/Hemi2/26220_TR8797_c0_g1_i1.p1 gnl/Hemi2/26220_TR8797_c0_g1~~gnl/Hemi2/26220_TR8797_c0_g1_i1.p1  ORF type:complete len:497 (+),score=136.03 gnl/Hemi2/26220_TR8797_c0_g1_i1:137-1627(+)